MSNNTIPNVPRELLERILGCIDAMGWDRLEADIRALLSAPSPAGAKSGQEVEAVEVFAYGSSAGYQPVLLRQSIGSNGERISCYDIPLCRLSDATAIIDGLRGEVAKINSDRLACWAEFKVMTRACLDAEKERDQQAQRIAELEGLLRDCYPGCGLTARQTQSIRERIDAALSAGVGRVK